MPTVSLQSPYAVAPDTEVIAIGDIHGMMNLFESLLAQAAALPRQAEKRVLVLLGDLIDRGANSLPVLEAARDAGQRVGADQQVNLFGNHEQLLSMAISEYGTFTEINCWMRNGGARLIDELVEKTVGLKKDADILEALGKRVTPWLAGLQSHYTSGQVLFVHAGIHPGRSLDKFLSAPVHMRLHELTEDEHWAWIRRPFLDNLAPHGHHGHLVVHGHSIISLEERTTDDAERLRMSRVNLDAGSFLNGKGRLARLVGNTVEIIELNA